MGCVGIYSSPPASSSFFIMKNKKVDDSSMIYLPVGSADDQQAHVAVSAGSTIKLHQELCLDPT